MRAPAYSTLIIALLIAIAAVVFAFQNDGEIGVQFMKWNASASVATALLVSFGSGVAAATLALLPTLMRAVRNASVARREMKRLGRELEKEKAHERELVQEVAKARGAAEQAQKDAQAMQQKPQQQK